MLKHVIPNLPYIYQGIVPRCHVTSLMMILQYYGLEYSQSYLMNLSGYNYGFSYYEQGNTAYEQGNRALACPESSFGSWAFMAYALEKLGCKTTFIKDRTWEETWKLLKEYVSQDIPVYMPLLNMKHLWRTSRPIPHVVVLCGYDEMKGVVMIHDPALGEAGEGIRYLPSNGLPRGKSGSYAEFKIEDFREACHLKRRDRKNGLCVIEPPNRKPNISWSEVIARNAKLTLGQVEEVVGKHAVTNSISGSKGLMEFAGDLEKGFGLIGEPGDFFETIDALRSIVFIIGSSYRKDAHAFIAGVASVTDSEDLYKASYYLGVIGLCYEQGLAEIDYLMTQRSISEGALRERLTRISEVLKKAAKYEQEVGEHLGCGARALA